LSSLNKIFLFLRVGQYCSNKQKRRRNYVHLKLDWQNTNTKLVKTLKGGNDL